MLAFKHNAGEFGALGTLASDAETSGGPISLHTAIEDLPGVARVHGLEERLAPGGVAIRTYHPQGAKGSRIKAFASCLRSIYLSACDRP